MLTNKKILIAGAGGLLGSHVTKELLRLGAKLIVSDINIDAIKSRLDSIGVDLSSNMVFEKLDVTNETQVKQFFQTIEGLDGAVNCSYPRNKTYGAKFLDVSLESFNENLSLHLGSAFLFSQQCAVYFEEFKTPFSLVNITSIYGLVAPKFDVYAGTQMTTPVEYAAIKSAIIHLNKYISAYMCDSKFRVNSVCPGGLADGQPDSFLQAYKRNTNGTGMLSVEDVVGAIQFLLSDASLYINGQNIVVDDGFSL